MKVRMRVQITGTRDGEDWPPIGGVADLPKDEAEHLIAIGHAVVPEAEKASEPAPSRPEPEKATAKKATTRNRKS